MKVVKIVIVIFFSLIMITGCKSVTYECQPVTEIPIIDGKNLEWENIPQYYDEDNEAVFAFVKSDSFLFVLFQTANLSLIRKFVMGGGGVWWGPEANKDKVFGLVYPPMAPEQGKLTDRPQGMRNSTSGNIRDIARMTRIQWELVTPRFMNETTGQQSQWNEIPYIATAGSQQDGNVCFEFQIPSSTISDIGIDMTRETFYVGLEIAGMDKDEIASMQSQRGRPGGGMGGGRGGGMGGSPGGGMRGGGPGGAPPGGAQDSDMFKETNLWFKLQ